MPRTPSPKTAGAREPVQVYLSADDVKLLSRLVEESGLSKAEILRRGIRSYAREHGQRNQSPMLRFLAETTSQGWPKDVASQHDDALALVYRTPGKRRRR